MAKMGIRAGCAFFFIALSVSASLAENENWQWAVSPFYAPIHSASIKGQLIFAPDSLDKEGWQFRYDARLSSWKDRNPLALRSTVIESDDSFYAGYSFHNGPWRAKLFGGATIYSDNQFALDVQFGASALGELVWLSSSGEFIGFEARGSSIKNNWHVSVVSGWPVGWNGLKLGPEGGVGGNITGWNARAGVAATGLKLANCDLSLSLGAIIDDQDRVGSYASLWLSGRF